MIYTRRHSQRNLVNPDIALSAGKNAAEFKEVNLLEEIFEVTTFSIILSAGSFEFSADKNIHEVIESQNYFTILDGDGRHCLVLNKDKVESFEFVLKKDKKKEKEEKKEKEK